MIRSAVCLFMFAFACGCSGRTIADADAGGSDGSAADSSAIDAGADCGQPDHVVYICPHPNPSDAGICTRFGGTGDLAPIDAGFAIGCTATLPRCDPNFGGPQTCNCDVFPVGDAGAQWVCPL